MFYKVSDASVRNVCFCIVMALDFSDLMYTVFVVALSNNVKLDILPRLI